MFDITKIREDFPILQRQVYNKPLIYFDNAATTQKPKCVVDAITDEYYSVNANVHRGVHFLSQQATDLHEAARETVKNFINAPTKDDIVFTRGTTEGLNLVANCLAKYIDTKAPEVLATTMEHHSNIVPWQLNGFKVKPFSISDLSTLSDFITENTKIISITHVSNVLGIHTPVKEIIRIAHEHNIPVLIDGAQSAPHIKVDVQDLDCDFFVFSGHKVYAPTGIGVLYGKKEWLDKLPPYQGGGEMIKKVTFDHTTYEVLPYKFEAGTPDYVGSHALAVALDYVSSLGIDNISAYEQELTAYALQQLSGIKDIQIYDHPVSPVISFNLKGIHHLDVGTLLDRFGIAVRTGHHCAQPLMQQLGVEGTVRASFAFYNTHEEVDTLVSALQRIQQMF